MFGQGKGDDYSPLGWVGRVPLYATTLLLGGHVAAMLAEAVLVACGQGRIAMLLPFESGPFFSGQFWRAATYVLFHVPSGGIGYLWFALEMYLLYAFGREVERYLGRRSFLGLYALLVLAPSIPLILFGLAGGSAYAGSQAAHFGLFVAFAALYPDVEMMLRVRAKWVALIFLGVMTLDALVVRNWPGMSVAWLSAGIGWLFVEWLKRGGPAEAVGRIFRGERAPEPDPGGRYRDAGRRGGGGGGEPGPEDIDPLLEKIARKGMASLTREERDRLERARRALLRRG